MTAASGGRRRLLVWTLVVSLLVVGSSAVAVASHYDENDYDQGASDFRVDTYGGPSAEGRAPGATDRSYWSESITYGIPEGEKVYLTETVTYRPIPSACAAEDTEEFGIDRDATYEGERRIDDSATESVKSFGKEEDARAKFENRYGQFGSLATTDWGYVERLEVQWYAPDDIGAPLEIYYGDRFVSAQRECLDNPDAAGWYRFASINEGEFENGTTVSQDAPTFSHWFYICDCANRQEAVETLGPPPSEEAEGGDGDGEREPRPRTPTATADAAGGDAATATASDDENGVGTEREAATGTEAAGTSTATGPRTPASTATERSEATPTGDWDDRVLRTPTDAEGGGFTPLVTVLAAGAAVALAARR